MSLLTLFAEQTQTNPLAWLVVLLLGGGWIYWKVWMIVKRPAIVKMQMEKEQRRKDKLFQAGGLIAKIAAKRFMK